MFRTIYNRIRLLMLRHKEPYVLYRKLLGFYPTDIHLYEQACLHRSSSICEQGRRINNERLEFLGDAILDAIVADILFHKFKTSKEGFLTNTRAKIVKRESLNEIAVKLGLDNFITYSMPSKPSSEPFIWIKDTDTAKNSSRPVSSTHISISKKSRKKNSISSLDSSNGGKNTKSI